MTIQKLKYLSYYSNYIAEQEFAEDGTTDPQAAAAAPKERKFSFIFIDENSDDEGYKYPDGSTSKKFPTYEISETDLDKWLNLNIKGDKMSESAEKVKTKAMKEYISGTKDSIPPDDNEFLEKFKNAILADMEGKQIHDTEVVFSPKENEPTTSEVEVTFITLPKNV